jgi:hypothetical protein
MWECDGAPPEMGQTGVWEVREALLRPDGFVVDCFAKGGDAMDVRLTRRTANEFDGTWRWKGSSGAVSAVLRVLGERVFGSAIWHDPTRGVAGRWLFELQVLRRMPNPVNSA